uniref:Uncharacterized protein n=1 Tax=Molossus molossus TaxID=27622 RepID=A0A7J8ERA8_MOLMO|nr:hypothetical protein HJG59_008719 [Molossus molossus]
MSCHLSPHSASARGPLDPQAQEENPQLPSKAHSSMAASGSPFLGLTSFPSDETSALPPRSMELSVGILNSLWALLGSLDKPKPYTLLPELGTAWDYSMGNKPVDPCNQAGEVRYTGKKTGREKRLAA